MLTTKQISTITMAYLNDKPLYVYEDLNIGLVKRNNVICIISKCNSLEQMINAVTSALWFYTLEQA